MGYMTVVSILNDAWDTIKQNPEQFIKNIEEGMHNYNGKAVNHYPVSNYANPMEVHTSFHANLNHVLVVGGNHMEDVVAFQPSRSQEDFYLAYKLRTAQMAKDIAASALIEAQDVFASLVAKDMKTMGKTVDDIADFITRYDAFAEMEEDMQQLTIIKVGIRLEKGE